MAREVFILGGGGQIGRATARRFAREGWHVRIGGRTGLPADFPDVGAEFVRVDRRKREALGTAVGEADVLVDAVAFTADDAAQLGELAGKVGSCVVVSSASVYADDAGRSLDEASSGDGFPQLPVPIPETQRTVEPGPATYSTNKVALEQALLADDGLRTTIVRPCAIHGPGAELPRELFVVKRALDGRRVLPLAFRGETRFHTTSVDNLAELIWLAAARPGRRVVNCGDPEPPTALGITRAIASALGHEFVEVLLPAAPHERVGLTPWAVPHPLVVDMLTAELDLRYRPVTTYARAVRTTVEWLVATKPEPTGYLASFFDYAAEDDFLATLERV